MKSTEPITVNQPPSKAHHHFKLNPIYLVAAAFTKSRCLHNPVVNVHIHTQTHTERRLSEKTAKQINWSAEKKKARNLNEDWNEES